MDPNFFRVDLERAFELMVALVLVAMFLERALALLFEHDWFIKRFEDKHLKPGIAFAVAVAVCWYWKFDAVSVVVLRDTTSWPGYLITAGIVAGGSKASLAFFRDFLKVMSLAEKERVEMKRAKVSKAVADAQANG